MSETTEMPYAHRREVNGSWAVVDTHSSSVAKPRFIPLLNLSKIDAEEMACVLNREATGTRSLSGSLRDTGSAGQLAAIL